MQRKYVKPVPCNGTMRVAQSKWLQTRHSKTFKVSKKFFLTSQCILSCWFQLKPAPIFILFLNISLIMAALTEKK